MTDVIIGIIAIAAGALFCFRGHLAFRIVIPIWGAFVGFSVGAGIVAGIGGSGFLTTGLGWLVGIAVAILFAALAYLYYAVSVVIAMASIGFMIGASVMGAIGVSWTWVVVVVGVAVGLLLAYTAIVANLPMVLLVVLSALAGASAITTGVLLLVGTLKSSDLTDNSVTTHTGSTGTLILYAVLVIAGIVVQSRDLGRMSASMRESWETRGAARS